MNTDKFKIIIQNYIDRFDAIQETNHEVYKWNTLYHFRKVWDTSRIDFGVMLKDAFSQDYNLIGNRFNWPLSGLIKLCDVSEECMSAVRNAFIELSSYNSNALDKQRRVDAFVSKINLMLEENDFDGGYMQDYKNVVNFLAFINPEENYLLKVSYAHTFADYMEYGDGIGSGTEFKLEAYYRLCDEIVAEIGKYPEFIEKYNQELVKEAKKKGLDDYEYVNMPGKLQLIAYDLIYIAWQKNLYEGIEKPARRKAHKTESDKKNKESIKIEEQLNELMLELDMLEDEISNDSIDIPELVGIEVNHSKRFGKGEILSFENNKIIVRFNDKETSFIFPDAFVQGFIVSDDISLDVCQELFKRQKDIKDLKKHISTLKTKKSIL